MRGFFQIAEIVSSSNPVPERHRFRILETYVTKADGLRARITERSFATLEEAQAFIEEHEA
jgi:hypothetical protein